MSYWLTSEYARWTADPDDPELKRARKVKAPPIPLIPPVAYRPPSITAIYERDFAELVATHEAPTRTARERAEARWVTSAEFDSLIDAS